MKLQWFTVSAMIVLSSVCGALADESMSETLLPLVDLEKLPLADANRSLDDLAECFKQSGNNPYACLQTIHKRDDDELNDTYQRNLAFHPSRMGRQMVREAERRWIAYRDINCRARFYNDEGNDPYESIERDICIIRMTRERNSELNLYGD